MKTVLIFEPQDFSAKVITTLTEHGFEVSLNEDNISIKEALETFSIIYMRLSVKIDAGLLDQCNDIKCRFILIPATGIDHIDEQACLKHQIQIVSFKNKKELLKDIRATAELTIALTLTLLRNIIPAIESTKNGIWNRDLFRGKDIFGKKVGVIGYGRLGSIVADYFHTFGAIVQVYEKNAVELPSHFERASSINDIFLTNEIITLHVDYQESNIQLINSSNLMLAKKQPIFINTSRGQLVNEADLLTALESKVIAGAAIDVVNEELGFNAKNPLVTYANHHHNLIITPHIGGCTIDSSHKTEEIITNELLNQIKDEL
jgi:D-3-phosphoglycerate dehydrogenase